MHTNIAPVVGELQKDFWFPGELEVRPKYHRYMPVVCPAGRIRLVIGLLTWHNMEGANSGALIRVSHLHILR